MIRVRGTGRVYWGIEGYSMHPDKRLVARSFLVESIPPWRHSTHAMRFRWKKKELHIGLCRYGQDPEQIRPTPHSDPAVARVLQTIYDVDRNAE